MTDKGRPHTLPTATDIATVTITPAAGTETMTEITTVTEAVPATARSMAHTPDEPQTDGVGEQTAITPLAHRRGTAEPSDTQRTYYRQQLSDSLLVNHGSLAVSESSLYLNSFHVSLTEQLAAPFGQAELAHIAAEGGHAAAPDGTGQGKGTDRGGSETETAGTDQRLAALGRDPDQTLTISNRSVPEVALYTDASYYESDGVATTGIVIEKHDGTVVHTAGVELAGVPDSVTAEQHALIHGLLETRYYFGNAQIQAHADCHAVVEQARAPQSRQPGAATQALRAVLADVHIVKFNHINRAANTRADSVAGYTADLIRF